MDLSFGGENYRVVGLGQEAVTDELGALLTSKRKQETTHLHSLIVRLDCIRHDQSYVIILLRHYITLHGRRNDCAAREAMLETLIQLRKSQFSKTRFWASIPTHP